MSETAYILMGSNLGNRAGWLQEALAHLAAAELITVAATSSLYETAAQDMAANSPAFLNQAVALDTTLSPIALLDCLEAIERRCGRTGKGQYQSRTIDLDILYFGTRVISTDRLTIPHPRVLRRNFALVPLLELAPNLVDPVTHRSVIEYLATVDASAVQLYQSRVARAV